MPTSFSEWFNALVRHRLVAVLAFAGILLLTVCVILFSPRSYRSTSRLLLRIGHENASLDPTATITGDTITPMHTRENEIETALGVMQSRLIMEEVVDRVGVQQVLDESLPSDPQSADEQPGVVSRLTGVIKGFIRNIDPVSARETAVRALETGLDISAPSKSSVVTVQYQAENAVVAQNIVSAWVESYLGQHSKVNRTQGTFRFFAEQDEQLKRNLEIAHHELRDAKTQGGFTTLEGQQSLLEKQLETVRSELLTLDAELAESTSRSESIGKLLRTDVDATTTEQTSGIANQAHNEMRGLLFQLEVLENEYAAKYKDTHPKLIAIRDQLSNARKIFEGQETERTEFRETANPTHQQLSASRLIDISTQTALENKKLTLLKQLDVLLEEVSQLNKHEENLAHLSRNVETLEDRYKLHSIRLEQARLDELLEERHITSINVIQPASFEERPTTPNKKLCAVGGLFAAFAVAISLPVLLDVRNNYVTIRPSQLAAESESAAGVTRVSDTSSQTVASSVAIAPDSTAPLTPEPTAGATSRPR